MQAPEVVTVYKYWTLDGCWDPGFNPWPFLRRKDAEEFIKLIGAAFKRWKETGGCEDGVKYDGCEWVGLSTLLLDPDDVLRPTTEIEVKGELTRLEVVPWYTEEPFEEAATLCNIRDALEIYAR